MGFVQIFIRPADWQSIEAPPRVEIPKVERPTTGRGVRLERTDESEAKQQDDVSESSDE